MKSSLLVAQVILVTLFGVGCYGDDVGVNIGINVGEGQVDIDLSAVANPCESQACPEGQRCTVVYHPGFLAIPLAHCVYEDESQDNRQNASPGACIEVKVGSNVMKCKTEDQWRNVGLTQCSLRGGTDTPTLYSTQVAYACHRFDDSREAVFLQAAFTCCPDSQQDADSQQQAQTQVVDNDLKDDDFEHNRVLLYPLLIAAATVVALIIIIVAVWQRRRSRLRRPKHPKVIMATSFVNPSAEGLDDDEATPTYDIMDEYAGRSDKSLLIINEHTPEEYTPGN